jgi:hypothetical protein
LLVPLKYEIGKQRPNGKTESFDDNAGDPADRAIDPTDGREAIVDFGSVNKWELQSFCDHFGAALVWATKAKDKRQPDLMQMGARMLTIFQAMYPKAKLGMDLRIPKESEATLRRALAGSDPLQTGKFFRRPIMWVRRTNNLLQLGKRAYSMIYVMCGHLINSATCAAIGAMDNKSRQAANKLIQEFSDTFSGIKSLPMRGAPTRKRCKKAQTNN